MGFGVQLLGGGEWEEDEEDLSTVRYPLRRFETAGLARLDGHRGALRVFPDRLASRTLAAFEP